jgi:hypothetical protein
VQLNGPWISPLPSLYSKAESSSFLHPLCKYCSMAANDLHTSCRTVFVGVSFFGVMVRPGGKDIVYGVGGVGKARTTRFLQCAHCTKRERREGKEEKKKEVRTPFFEGEKQIRCDRTYVVLKIQLPATQCKQGLLCCYSQNFVCQFGQIFNFPSETQ